MKLLRYLITLVSIVLFAYLGLNRPQPVILPRHELTLLVYNIHGGFDAYNQPGLEQQFEVVRRAQADLIVLNEVDRFVDRSRRVDQVRWFADRLGYHYAFGPNVSYPPGEYGNAILSRYPIENSINHRLPMPAGMQREPRGALQVTIQVGNTPVTVLGTHFGLEPAERTAYADYLVQKLSQVKTPFVLAGDFNSTREWPELQTLWAHYRDALVEVGLAESNTFSSTNLRLQLDHIFLSQNLTPISGEIWTTTASDHLPVLITIGLP